MASLDPSSLSQLGGCTHTGCRLVAWVLSGLGCGGGGGGLVFGRLHLAGFVVDGLACSLLEWLAI